MRKYIRVEIPRTRQEETKHEGNLGEKNCKHRERTEEEKGAKPSKDLHELLLT